MVRHMLPFVFVFVVVQVSYAGAARPKGLRTPYVSVTPASQLMSRDPCRFYYFSPECQLLVSKQKQNDREHRELSSNTGQHHHGILMNQKPPKGSRQSHPAASITTLFKSFQEMCLRHPSSHLCPKKSPRIYGPFYMSKKPTTGSRRFHTSDSARFVSSPPVEVHRQSQRHSSIRASPHVIMAVVSKPNTHRQHAIDSGSPRKVPSPNIYYDKCSHPFHSWQCASRTNTQTHKTPNVSSRTPSKSTEFPIRPNAKSTNNQRTTINRPTEMPKAQKYNKCSHPFHSWLCDIVLTTPAPTTRLSTTRAKIDFNDNTPEITTVAYPTTPTPPTKMSPKTYDKCNHAFHSWLCRRARTRPQIVTEPPMRTFSSDGNTNVPSTVNTHFSPPLAATTPKPNYMDPCTHSFHSWLCKAVTLARNKPSNTPKSLQKLPKHTKSSPRRERPSHKQSNKPITTTTNRPTTTQPLATTMRFTYDISSFLNKNSKVTPLPSILSKETSSNYDPCRHGFHTWLCTKSKQLNNRPTTTPRPGSTYANYVTKLPIQSTTMTSQIPSPAPPTSKRMKPSWKGANPCTHAFHSWLCQPLRPKLTFKPFKFDVPPTQKQGKSLVNHRQPTSAIPTTTPAPTPKIRNADIEDNVKTVPFPTTTVRPIPSTTSHSRVKKYHAWDDSCNHPFHSWLCESFKKTTTIVPSYEIPNIRSLPLENEFVHPPLSVDNEIKRKTRFSESTTVTPSSLSFVTSKMNLNHAVSVQQVNQQDSVQTLQSSANTATNHQSAPSSSKLQIHRSSPRIYHTQVPESNNGKRNAEKAIRYKSISYSAPTDNIFKSLPNIGLLPLEKQESRKHTVSIQPGRSHRYIADKTAFATPTIQHAVPSSFRFDDDSEVDTDTQPVLHSSASSVVNVGGGTVDGRTRRRPSGVGWDDIPDIDLFTEFESQRTEPRGRA